MNRAEFEGGYIFGFGLLGTFFGLVFTAVVIYNSSPDNIPNAFEMSKWFIPVGGATGCAIGELIRRRISIRN